MPKSLTTLRKINLLGLIILTLFISLQSISSTQNTGVQVGDDVRIEYTLWVAEPESGLSGEIDTTAIYQGPAEFSTTVQKGSLINGFYYGILGMEVGEEKTFEVPANIDVNEDGSDDNTGEEVLSYASPTHALYNTNLMFKVKIISINGISDNFETESRQLGTIVLVLFGLFLFGAIMIYKKMVVRPEGRSTNDIEFPSHIPSFPEKMSVTEEKIDLKQKNPMFCQECGAALQSDSPICFNCGYSTR
ncbi:FKBP-type peptidyl-prolyl cis-trans isomerase [Candidatus Lokiarchaeum ossiferum]|uniref:FKBP-type peptidyl-prolyl cis-trans isomerase n=1 Tax=Candidatus Lokiarchaeum ossiferum TaxID=2951803 RepID=UPI00352E9845